MSFRGKIVCLEWYEGCDVEIWMGGVCDEADVCARGEIVFATSRIVISLSSSIVRLLFRREGEESPSLFGFWRRFRCPCCIVGSSSHIASWPFSGNHFGYARNL